MTHSIPEGCIVDILSPTDDGYRVAEVWKSEEARQRIRCEILTPLLRRVPAIGHVSNPTRKPFPVPSARAISTE